MAFDASIDDLAQDRLLLQRARDVLIKDGWCVLRLESGGGQHCIMGALQVAKHGEAGWHVNPPGSRNEYDGALALMGFVGPADTHSWDQAANWNNAQTSVEPILARMDAAIAVTA